MGQVGSVASFSSLLRFDGVESQEYPCFSWLCSRAS